jgi:hydrogenase-4 component B
MTPGALLLVAAAMMVAGGLAALRAPRLWAAVTCIGTGASFAASVWVLTTGATWDWCSTAVVGEEAVHLRLDALSAFFLTLVSVIGAAGSLYALGYWPDRDHPVSAPAGHVWWNVLLASLTLVLLSANGLHFLFAWEIFTVSAYFLITSERHRREVRAAGWLYFAASHVATLCLFAFFAGLAARSGSWELGPMHARSDLAPLFWLALAGFGLKAGVFPLHIWLPSAHANAPSHVSALLSGVTIKMGIYGLARFSGWLDVPDAAGWVVIALGASSAVLGVAFALGQHDLKRLLAYHSVENIGIILIGLGFGMVASARGNATWGRLALAGGLLHVWNHALFKALLFLGAGSVLHATGTRQMSRLGGLWRPMPWTAGLFALGAAAIAGLPPLNGFVSEWLVFLGLFDAMAARSSAGWAAVPVAVLLGMTSALALACFVKVCGVVFLGQARTVACLRAHESGWSMRIPMLVLGGGCVMIGLAPVLIWRAVAHASMTWQPAWTASAPPTSLGTLGTLHVVLAVLSLSAAAGLWWRVQRNGVVRAPTWDCGYAAPSPRMQYTAGSFAAIITEWFSWILRPERHALPPQGPFPGHAHFETHTPETVLDRVVRPAGAAVMHISTAVRRLQHGRVQAYIFYLLLGLAALAAVALWGGGE